MHDTTPHNKRRYNLPIGWFVVFSLLLHGVLLWGVMSHQQEAPMPAAQSASAGFHISLMPYQVPTQKRVAKPQRMPQQNSTPQPEVATQPANEQVANNQETEQESDAGFRAQIMVKLRQALAAHFSYPLLARQRNWQGEVLLAFQLEQDGRISNARIARSSGYRLLDHAALSALGQIGKLTEIVPRSLSVELPVIYRLES